MDRAQVANLGAPRGGSLLGFVAHAGALGVRKQRGGFLPASNFLPSKLALGLASGWRWGIYLFILVLLLLLLLVVVKGEKGP